MTLIEWLLIAIAVGIYVLIREGEKARADAWRRWEKDRGWDD